MAYRYLESSEARTRLSVGRRIEQWLGHSPGKKYRLVRWLILEKEPSGEFSAVVREVFDEGKETPDLYGFSTLDPDLPFGEITSFDSVGEAWSFAEGLGARPDRFVASGSLQDVYMEFVSEHGHGP